MYYWTEYNEELHLKNIMAEARAEGRAEGITEGEERMSKLINILLSQQNYADLERVTTDKDFLQECFTLYNI